MRWPKDPKHRKPGLVYRIMRVLARSVTMIWFREVDIVDNENIPTEGGVVYIAWHPSGLIDPMLMVATLPGKLSIIAKDSLFKIPILGRIIRAAGALPIIRPTDVSSDDSELKKHNANQLSSVSQAVANGGQLIIFPEGTTHSESDIKSARTGAARIMQMALEQCDEEGLAPPTLIPIGLHYSDAHTFRERAAVIVERPMLLPELPDKGEDEEVRRQWVRDVTTDIESELKRASHASESWNNRRLVWRARSIVHAERSRVAKEKLTRPTYAQSVLGARRMRAGWEFLAKNEPQTTEEIENRARLHFKKLDKLGLHPLDIDVKPAKLTSRQYFKNLAMWIWSASWMLGIVTWGAVIGNIPPYYANRQLVNLAKRRGLDNEVVGTLKVYSSFVLFPLWWIIVSIGVVMLLLGSDSPVRELLASHWLLIYLTKIPVVLAGLVLLVCWPLSGRAHLVLHANATRTWRAIKRWKRWKDDGIDWDGLHLEQVSIAQTLVTLGDGLVLPGDPEWKTPPTGTDDSEIVSYR